MASQKISITVDEDVLDEIRSLSPQSLSGWFGGAAQNELRRMRLRHLLAEDDAEHGPVAVEVLREVEALWRA